MLIIKSYKVCFWDVRTLNKTKKRAERYWKNRPGQIIDHLEMPADVQSIIKEIISMFENIVFHKDQ